MAGVAGAQGAQGIQGIQGIQGNTGATGSPGNPTLVADGAIAQSKVANLTTDLASKLDLAGGTVTGTANIHTLNVTGGAIVASGIRTQVPPANGPAGVYLGMDGVSPNNCGIEITCGDVTRSSYIDFTRPGVNNVGRILVAMNTGLMAFTSSGGFLFNNPVSCAQTLAVTGATTCSANLSLGSTLTWGGVTYQPPTSTIGSSAYPSLLSVKADGVTEVGKIIDFHSGSSIQSEDYVVRLTASLNSLACTGAFTSLKHAGTAYPIEAFSVTSTPIR